MGQASSSGMNTGIAPGGAYAKVGNLEDTSIEKSTGSTGGGNANNLQPYITVYI